MVIQDAGKEKNLIEQKMTIKYLIEDTLSNEMARSILKIYKTPHKILQIFLAYITTGVQSICTNCKTIRFRNKIYF